MPSTAPLFASVTRLRRSRRVLFLLAVVVLTAGPAYDHYHHGPRLQRWAQDALFPDVISVQFSHSAARPAARIPRVVMDPALAGLSPEYVQHELERDKELNGGYNYTLDHRSHLPPASAFYNIRVAHPEAVPELQPQYRGLRCIDRYPLDHCPFPGICPPAAVEVEEKPCAVWGEGYPSSLERWIEGGGLQRPSTARRTTVDWDVPGRWKGDLWHPRGSSIPPKNSYHFFTPEEVHQCFKGKRIMFQGDSMVRQLFSRVIQYLRLLPTYCEHVFSWSTASYQTFPNGTDRFQPDCPNAQCDFPDDVLYSIIYAWHDERNETKNLQKLKDLKIDIAVHGIVYWIAWDQDLLDSRDSFTRLFEEDKWHGSLSWFLTPLHSVTQPYLYSDRNTKMRDFFNMWRLHKGRENVGVIPIDRVVERGNGRDIMRDRQPVDSLWLDVHHMCDYDNVQLHEPIKPGLQNLKAPMDWDARDMVNFNVMQLWLNSVCEPSS
ncbi:hypothetical protein EXIGLDRAFT_776669 [Exidia glandulosa HHB12029]|uniref:Uncharacterized protein n=1 Tax=Exidia glandulosa HHB12029 TaxID=1314781 RepID=A0A165DE64_EXIGL|nr:hypothetical protein EXIGLDRAFT_776669 [Exidia glandulosa HHB12029]